MRSQKPKYFTPDQESAFLKTESIMTRSRIIERGIANYLNCGDHATSAEIAVATEMLAESNTLRIKAEKLRADIRRVEMESRNRPNPTKRRRRA